MKFRNNYFFKALIKNLMRNILSIKCYREKINISIPPDAVYCQLKF